MIDMQESSEDYLERILMLQKKGMKEVHAVDLAASFNYSKASISIALKKLKDRGLVALGPKQQLYLTPDGLEIASRIYERHEVIGSIFTYLGVEEEVAYKDACKIEHDISEETYQVLKKRYKELKK
jgi:Mn-dependent transcriptional regulator